MREDQELIPQELFKRLRSAAAAVGIPCEGGPGVSASDVLAWLDREGWSWQVGHEFVTSWTCILSRDTWPGLVHTRLDFLIDESDSLAEAVAFAFFHALGCGLVAAERRLWGDAWARARQLTPETQSDCGNFASVCLTPDQVRVLRRAFLLAGLEWPFGSEVSADVVVRWMRACGWEAQVQGPEDALVTVRRTVRLGDEVVELKDCFCGGRGDAESSLVEAVTAAALWVFAVAGCELKGTVLGREATYGRMDPAGTMTLFALIGNAVELWPFGLSPTMFEVAEWLEQQGWEWNLSRDNIPEHVFDDPDWRKHQWGLILSGHGHLGIAYWGETVTDMLVSVFHDLLGDGEEGVEVPDFQNPPDDEELPDVPPLDDEMVMEAIRAADRRFEPPPWMVEYVQEREDAGDS